MDRHPTSLEIAELLSAALNLYTPGDNTKAEALAHALQDWPVPPGLSADGLYDEALRIWG